MTDEITLGEALELVTFEKGADGHWQISSIHDTEPKGSNTYLILKDQPELQPECSDWKCYMFGNRPDGYGITYFPVKGQVPNRFVRFMMKVCFDCLWVKEDNND